MPRFAKLVRPVVTIAALCCGAAAAFGENAAAFQTSIQNLARSGGATYDPAYLAGIGQIYCHMKAVVGDEPLRPDTVLAVLHQKHPDTQPRSRGERDAQRRAMVLAGTLLCPDNAPSAAPGALPPN